MGGAQLEESSSWAGMGIGMANISERLQVLYGDTARMTIDSHEGKGTLIRIRLPLVEADEFGPRRLLRRALQHAPVEIFVLLHDLGRAESFHRYRPRLLSHLAQLLFIAQQFDGVSRHGVHVAHVGEISASCRDRSLPALRRRASRWEPLRTPWLPARPVQTTPVRSASA